MHPRWTIHLLTVCLLVFGLAGCQSAAATRAADPAPATAGPHPKDGFVTFDEEGRIWVFQADAKELADFREKGELAKFVVRPGAGPEGKTLKAPDSDTIVHYMTRTPGFVTFLEEGRLWVFREGDAALADFEAKGELAKFVVRPAAGPLGMTLKAPDAETLDAYHAAQ
ncbi:hypothetical protein [Desulfatitalea alkaliphila]|uniref:Uncharacterized protein n=1 Tax=Desulfatitalea alkaliphila TaxID=2929485 RepID=A0AA41UKE0_9BACT|nr:hypothetical protein [Desulfatitalea alkaliphila]MCJ8500326.1 hypothetical protein [Desulfatitalea alkaliphila]